MTQQEALDIARAGYNIYLTGYAGSGKSYLLDQFIFTLRRNKVPYAVTASTGIAATQLAGMTLHAWAGLGMETNYSDEALDNLLKKHYLQKRLNKVEVLIVDEVSMLPATTFEHVDRLLRKAKHSTQPFGGIQLVLCGDFFQLPPVVSSVNCFQPSDHPYVFTSQLWNECDFAICYLDKPFRQKEEKFLSLLHDIRSNTISQNTWQTIKERFINQTPPEYVPTKLYTHNTQADAVNTREIMRISEKEHTYLMEYEGHETLVGQLKRSVLASETLTLKKNAKVMFIKNNKESGYVNGTQGEIVDFESGGFPVVALSDGKLITAYPQEWTIEDNDMTLARILQIPLRLAWAITIHKSQGMTLESAEIDLSKSFVEGLGYVALSRVKTLDGIKLRGINRTALNVNSTVMKFDFALRLASQKLQQDLHAHSYTSEHYAASRI